MPEMAERAPRKPYVTSASKREALIEKIREEYNRTPTGKGLMHNPHLCKPSTNSPPPFLCQPTSSSPSTTCPASRSASSSTAAGPACTSTSASATPTPRATPLSSRKPGASSGYRWPACGRRRPQPAATRSALPPRHRRRPRTAPFIIIIIIIIISIISQRGTQMRPPCPPRPACPETCPLAQAAGPPPLAPRVTPRPRFPLPLPLLLPL